MKKLIGAAAGATIGVKVIGGIGIAAMGGAIGIPAAAVGGILGVAGACLGHILDGKKK